MYLFHMTPAPTCHPPTRDNFLHPPTAARQHDSEWPGLCFLFVPLAWLSKTRFKQLLRCPTNLPLVIFPALNLAASRVLHSAFARLRLWLWFCWVILSVAFAVTSLLFSLASAYLPSCWPETYAVGFERHQNEVSSHRGETVAHFLQQHSSERQRLQWQDTHFQCPPETRQHWTVTNVNKICSQSKLGITVKSSLNFRNQW